MIKNKNSKYEIFLEENEKGQNIRIRKKSSDKINKIGINILKKKSKKPGIKAIILFLLLIFLMFFLFFYFNQNGTEINFFEGIYYTENPNEVVKIIEPKSIENSTIIIDGYIVKLNTSSGEYKFPNSGNHTVQIRFYFLPKLHSMFSNCKSLIEVKKLIIESSISSIRDASFMFSNCINLIKINLFKFNSRYVTNMNFMFMRCQKLVHVDLSDFNTKNVRQMQGMFSSCESIKSLDLSNFNTKHVRDMSYMFYQCVKLENINLSSFDTSNVLQMTGMFSKCYMINSLDLSHFRTDKVVSMSSMFSYCKNLYYLNLKNFKASMEIYGIFDYAYPYMILCFDYYEAYGIFSSLRYKMRVDCRLFEEK